MNLLYKIFGLLLVTFSITEANPPSVRIIGLAAIKEQTFHDDASAKVVPYTELVDDRKISVKINTGRMEFAFERSKLAGTVELLASLPNDIRTESELAPVRMNLNNLSNFSTRFPNSEPFLKSTILTLTSYINSFEHGARRLEGRWIDKRTIEEKERVESEKIAEAKRLEEKKLAEIDRLERLRIAEAQRVEKLKSEEAARVGRARAQSIELQNQVLTTLQKGNVNLATTLMKQATLSSESVSLGSFATGIELFVALSADKSLNSVDTDWKKPTLPDADVFKKIPGLLSSLSKYEKQGIHPGLARLPEGLRAANLLFSFSTDYQAYAGEDQTHPIRALRNLTKSEEYRTLRDSDTFFAKPFLSRLSALNKLIGPKLAEYDTNIAIAKQLEQKEQFQEAALKYRSSLELEPSRDLESSIKTCEEKITGL